jgi:hypothetical protein
MILKDKKSFISWCKEKKESDYQSLVEILKKLNYKNIEREYIYNNLHDIYLLNYSKPHWFNICRNQILQNIDYDRIIDNKVMNFFQNYFYNKPIEVWEYEYFLISLDNIREFQKYKLSTDKKTYDRQVKKLEEMANSLSLYTKEPIVITIYRRPTEILSFFVYKLNSTDRDILNYFLGYFGYSTKKITSLNYIRLTDSNNNDKNPFFYTYKAHNLGL